MLKKEFLTNSLFFLLIFDFYFRMYVLSFYYMQILALTIYYG